MKTSIPAGCPCVCQLDTIKELGEALLLGDMAHRVIGMGSYYNPPIMNVACFLKNALFPNDKLHVILREHATFITGGL